MVNVLNFSQKKNTLFYPTIEMTMLCAARYKNYEDFKLNSKGCYKWCVRYDWLNDVKKYYKTKNEI